MGPLEGVRVLDLSRVLAGPIAARMLRDLGADVVKVEPPEGDVSRQLSYRRGNQSGYFVEQNAGKRGLCVDLGQPGGVDVVKALAGVADVVLENFRPGVLTKYGLDWSALSADHPELVMVSISGFGQEGPESGRAAYAGIISAESGWLDRQATASRSSPIDSQLSVADTTSGLHSVIAILSALRVRDQTGVGQYVDIAMVDALAVIDDYLTHTLDGGNPPVMGGGIMYNGVGGPVIIHGDFRWIWRAATQILGLDDPTPPGATIPEKAAIRGKAWDDYLLSFPDRASMIAALDQARLAWGDVKTTAEALKSPTLAHRGTIIDVDDRAGGRRKVIQSPYRFSHSISEVRGPAPTLGEHNAEVLREWLGMDSSTIDALVGGGVLITDAVG